MPVFGNWQRRKTQNPQDPEVILTLLVPCLQQSIT